ncbi:uncharacterized protein LOC119767327 [Culex quinquefasciatus]|uniref:uncharacterized protein LOC119767327 n=1 Tax=Culex quinquefasciatus TaxID=7176 RepID=UPI0018E2DD56|nr:uncharacterized protein LOC119767327 [Culex quinquefasciatus]
MSPDKERSKPGRAFGAVLTTGNESKPEDWFFDSGASRHLTRTKSLLHDVQRANGKMVAANKEGMQVVAKGTAVINTTCGEEINVTDVQLIPGLAANLLSVSKIVDKGYTVVFRRNGCEVLDEEGICVATGSRSDGLFKLEQEKLRVLTCRSRQRRRRRARNGSPCTVVKLDYEDGTKEVDEVSVRSPRVSGGQKSDGPSTPVVLRVTSSSRRPVDGSFQYPTHDDPNVHKATLTQDISNGWRRAMQEEYNAHRTWEMTNLQGGVYGPVLGCGSPGVYRHPTSFYEGHVGMCRCRCDLHQG